MKYSTDAPLPLEQGLQRMAELLAEAIQNYEFREDYDPELGNDNVIFHLQEAAEYLADAQKTLQDYLADAQRVLRMGS